MTRQLKLGLKFWGGLRKGAGKKPKGARAMGSHEARPQLNGRHPVHVTMRVHSDIPSLRAMHRAVHRALVAGAGSRHTSFRLIHFAILCNHLHLIAEGDSTKALSRGIKGLAIRIAWAVNRAMGRKRGKVFSDRYHSHVLGTPSETRAALLYVMNNYRRHMARSGHSLPPDFRDRSSSAFYWRRDIPNPFPAPQTWFLRAGYLKAGGEIDLSKTPGRIPKPKSSQRQR